MIDYALQELQTVHTYSSTCRCYEATKCRQSTVTTGTGYYQSSENLVIHVVAWHGILQVASPSVRSLQQYCDNIKIAFNKRHKDHNMILSINFSVSTSSSSSPLPNTTHFDPREANGSAFLCCSPSHAICPLVTTSRTLSCLYHRATKQRHENS